MSQAWYGMSVSIHGGNRKSVLTIILGMSFHNVSFGAVMVAR